LIHIGEKGVDESFTFLAANSPSDFVIIHRALQDSADRLHSSFQAHGPEGGYLSTKKARDVLVKTGLEKDQLRKIWNLSDIDRDGLFDHDEYGKYLLKKRGCESRRGDWNIMTSRILTRAHSLIPPLFVSQLLLCSSVMLCSRKVVLSLRSFQLVLFRPANESLLPIETRVGE
jgi:hypothetical protein